MRGQRNGAREIARVTNAGAARTPKAIGNRTAAAAHR
jgi:hypothetical protein